MALNDVLDRLKAEREAREAREAQRQAEAPKPQPVKDQLMTLPDEMPTMRDLSTALYKLQQQPTCRNCIRRERGDCPSRAPMPKTCVSFQLNSKQMQTYGQQARNVITAWRTAIEIHAARTHYYNLKTIQDHSNNEDHEPKTDQQNR